MILHGLQIKHWRCISSLELHDLNHPLVVLHGPNRTGKSSIVLALRACLFDYDHDSRAKPLLSCVPRATKQSPEVTVDFEVDSGRYRIHKIFSTAKDGDAVLERITDTGSSVVERGKEAGRQTRLLLEGEKSDQGLNELLWLTQGEVQLPAADRLNASLQQRLESTLGTLLTAHDWRFHEALRQEYRKFFTPTGQVASSSPVQGLRKQAAELDETVAQLRQSVQQGETLLREFESLEQDSVESRLQLEQSRTEVATLTATSRNVQQRKQAFDEATAAVTQAAANLKSAQAAQANYADQQQQLAGLERETIAEQAAVSAAQTTLESVGKEITKSEQAVQELRDSRQQLDGLQAELNDRTQLVELANQRQQLTNTLTEIEKQHAEIQQLQQQLNNTPAPHKSEIDQLRDWQQEITKLTERIAAASAVLQWEPEQAGDVEVQIDGSDSDTHSVAANTPLSLQFRESIQLHWPGRGKLSVRGQQDRGQLHEAATRLQQIRTEYHDGLAKFDVDTTQADPTEQLLQRRYQRDTLEQQLQQQQKSLKKIGTDSVQEVRAQLQQAERARDVILERAPDLADWEPSSTTLAELRQQAAAQRRNWQTRYDAAESKLKSQQAERETAREALQKLQETSAHTRARKKVAEQQLQAAGTGQALSAAVEHAVTALSAAQQTQAAAALTPEEEQAEHALQQAVSALEKRQARLHDLDTQQAEIRGRMQQQRGLHEELAAKEAGLLRIQADLKLQEEHAAACRYLLNTFEQCRQEQVKGTTGLIESQVVRWARQIGLAELNGLQFSKGYLPDAVHAQGLTNSFQVDEESWGTQEQFALLVRLAVGRLLANGQRQTTILDDPLTHADAYKHRQMLAILEEVANGKLTGDGEQTQISPLQMLIFTCHPDRFDHLTAAHNISLPQRMLATTSS